MNSTSVSSPRTSETIFSYTSDREFFEFDLESVFSEKTEDYILTFPLSNKLKKTKIPKPHSLEPLPILNGVSEEDGKIVSTDSDLLKTLATVEKIKINRSTLLHRNSNQTKLLRKQEQRLSKIQEKNKAFKNYLKTAESSSTIAPPLPAAKKARILSPNEFSVTPLTQKEQMIIDQDPLFKESWELTEQICSAYQSIAEKNKIQRELILENQARLRRLKRETDLLRKKVENDWTIKQLNENAFKSPPEKK